MTYCDIPEQLMEMISTDAESGRYVMGDEAAQRYFDTLSRIIGMDLKKNVRARDIVPIRFDSPLSEEVLGHRAEKYD